MVEKNAMIRRQQPLEASKTLEKLDIQGTEASD